MLNHHTELDWLFAWQLADRGGLVSFLLFLLLIFSLSFFLLLLFAFSFDFCLATGRSDWIGEPYSW